MHILTAGQLSILHSLRDGDHPLERADAGGRATYRADMAALARLGLIEHVEPRSALTLSGLDALMKPGHSCPFPPDVIDP